MRNKILSGILAAVMAMSLLSACGSPAARADGKEPSVSGGDAADIVLHRRSGDTAGQGADGGVDGRGGHVTDEDAHSVIGLGLQVGSICGRFRKNWPRLCAIFCGLLSLR